MSIAVQNRRGTTAEHANFTGLTGEVTVDTTLKTVVVHDGVTKGGNTLLSVAMGNAKYAPSGYGLGTNSITNTNDLNTIITTGFYYVSGINKPDATNGYLFVESMSSAYVKQTFTPVDSSIVYTRICFNNTWFAWTKMATTNSPVFGGNVGIGVASPQATLHSTGSTILGCPWETVADAGIGNNQFQVWLDQTNNKLTFRVRNSSGVLQTAVLALS